MELLLLRHAEARPALAGQADVDRPLSEHGQAQARAVGAWLARQLAPPEGIVCSPARRTRETTRTVLAASGWTMPVAFDARIYEASAGELLAMLDARSASTTRLLLVGHNPGLSHLLALLCGRPGESLTGMTPACLAHLRVTPPVEPGCGHLLDMYRPPADTAMRS